jgi:zinc protease
MHRAGVAALSVFFASMAALPASAAGRVQFTETTLKNGLRVQLVEDRTAPVIAVSVAYNVGAKDERKGLTGFAHLFEHMMFKGSANVGDGEHFYQIFTAGGSLNGTTYPDLTNYYETLPANQLEMALFLESDRMRSLEITQENLDNQRHAVQEERRLRMDNQPYGRSYERLTEMLYENFAYRHPTIGSMEDLNAASIEDIAEFFATYYAPNNAVLSLVGDFDRRAALKMVRRYFEKIPRRSAPPRVDLSEPAQNGERRDTIGDPLARMTHIYVAFKTVPGNHTDQPALNVLSSILQGGDSSRLYQKLSKERELVAGISGFVDERIGPGALYISATVRPGQKSEEVERAIYEEIAKLQREPVAAWEMQKAKNVTRVGYFNGIRGAQSRAVALGMYTVKYNDPSIINTIIDKIDAVTPEDVQRVARRYLVQTNRTVLITEPATERAAQGGAQ